MIRIWLLMVVCFGLSLRCPVFLQEPSSPADVNSLQKQLQAAYDRVKIATVAIRSVDGSRSYGSGAVIRDDGLVLASGHHQLETQTPVSVWLGDGRKVNGRVLSVHEPFDISLIRIDSRGTWPSVVLGHPERLQVDDSVLALGYPAGYRDRFGREPEDGRPPLLRVGRVLQVSATQILSTARIWGGDSGGPLYDLDGRLVGVHGLQQTELSGYGHARVDLFRQAKEQLLAGKHVRKGSLSGPFASGKMPGFAEAARKSVVTVEVDGQRVAFGVIVDADGLVITKRSSVRSGATCRLRDGRRLAATIVADSHAYDLVLLRISIKDLPAIDWSSNEPRPGMLVASVANESTPAVYGVVSSSPASVEAERGYFLFNSEPTEGKRGIRVTSVTRALTRKVLKKGDIITHIDGVSTPDAQSFLRVRDARTATGIVGESILFSINRNDQKLDVNVPIESETGSFMHGRHTGFPAGFIHDSAIRRGRLQRLELTDLGTPVVDTEGRVVGISIGIVRDYNYALPAGDVRRIVDQLVKRTKQTSPR